MSDDELPARGYANFRDLGGHSTPSGPVKHREVYRSDTLSHVDDAEVEHLVERLGIRTIIDLRHENEILAMPLSSLEAAGVSVHHVPLVDPAQPSWQPLEASATLGERYEFILGTAGSQFVVALRLIAEAGHRPLVFQCMAGKDRTGLLAALLLGILGASEETIVADYARSSDAIPAMLARLDAGGSVYDPEVVRPYLTADAATMEYALAKIGERYGSIEQYVTGNGLELHEIASLRAALVEPGE